MAAIQLNFSSKPGIVAPMVKALLMPRKGFNASVGLPDIHASWSAIAVDQTALSQYANTLGIQLGENLPLLYPHVMAGAMHMHMLTHKAFPIKLLGALHLKNRIEQNKPVPTNAMFDLNSQLGGFRLVEKGVEFDFDTQLVCNGETYWQETSTYFMAGRFGGKENPSSEKSFELAPLENGGQSSQWFIPADRGKVYAKITGDYNPIHTSKQLAKLFGFKRDIAHGFGVLGQAIEHLNGLPNGSVNGAVNGQAKLDVIFKGSVFLESDVKLMVSENAQRFDIYCADNDRPSICAELLMS